MMRALRSMGPALAALCAASFANAAVDPPPAPVPARAGVVEVVMRTAAGDITLELYQDRAPVTVANFLRYVDEGRYAGARFYRTVRADNDRNPASINVIQGGIEGAAALPPIAHETTETSGLRHVDGTISMARLAPGSASSEFFICIGENPVLDYGGARNADGQGFAAFGRVTQGMEIVRRIHSAASNAPTDEPYVRGQILDEPVVIRSVERRDAASPSAASGGGSGRGH